MSGLQNNSWQYWNHFHTIQPNAAAKGQRAFQPSYHANDNNGTPSSMDTAIPVNDLMSIDSIPATPATAEKRPLEVGLDSDSESGTCNCPSSSTMVGSGFWSVHHKKLTRPASPLRLTHHLAYLALLVSSSHHWSPQNPSCRSLDSLDSLQVLFLNQGTSKCRQPKIWATPLP